jgi:hypothetical protein
VSLVAVGRLVRARVGVGVVLVQAFGPFLGRVACCADDGVHVNLVTHETLELVAGLTVGEVHVVNGQTSQHIRPELTCQQERTVMRQPDHVLGWVDREADAIWC